jgi:hypothetical protein
MSKPASLPPRDRQQRSAVKTALLLAVVAFGFYIAFVLTRF